MMAIPPREMWIFSKNMAISPRKKLELCQNGEIGGFDVNQEGLNHPMPNPNIIVL